MTAQDNTFTATEDHHLPSLHESGADISAEHGRVIVLPVTSAPLSEYTVKWARKHILTTADTLVLVNVRSTKFYADRGDHGSVDVMKALETIDAAERDEALAVIRALSAVASDATLHGAVPRVVEGYAVKAHKIGEAIVAKAHELHADSIVMAARSGRGFVTKALLGSVSEYVTKHADIPVVIVRDKLQLAREAKLKAEVEMHDSDAHKNPMVERITRVE